MDREDSSTFVVGGVLLTIGVALLVDRMGLLQWTGQWSVWPLLLIGFGVVNLVESPWRGARGVFPIALGLWLWAAEAGWIQFRDSWPLIFVMLGIAVMWQTWAMPADAPDRTLQPRRRGRRSPLVGLAIVAAILAATTIDARRYVAKPDTTGERIHVMTMMGQAQRTSSDVAFKSADVVTVMGESTLDLRNANVADGEDVTVDLFAMMGSVIIRIPESWTVDTRALPVMAQIADRRGLPEPPPRSRNRGRGRNDDDWGVQGSQGSQSSATSEPGDASAAVERAKSHRLILTGFVTMGNVVIR